MTENELNELTGGIIGVSIGVHRELVTSVWYTVRSAYKFSCCATETRNKMDKKWLFTLCVISVSLCLCVKNNITKNL